MNVDVQARLSGLPDSIAGLFGAVRQIVCGCGGVEERLWANMPTYCSGGRFVRIIPFADHINVEAKGIAAFADKLEGYSLTPKGMLRLYPNREIPADILRAAFLATLAEE